MGFTANIDIAISFAELRVSSIRQQGTLKFRVCLYYFTHHPKNESQGETIFCHPYSIVRNNQHTSPAKNVVKAVNGKIGLLKQIRSSNSETTSMRSQESNAGKIIEQSEIDLNSQYYISKPYMVQCQRQAFQVLETCCFRTYVDVEEYENLNLRCMVELLFCPEIHPTDISTYKVIGRSECKVRKLFDVSTFLPIIFDEFEGVALEGVYQSALIDFHYEKNENNGEGGYIQHQNFHLYLKDLTNGFNRNEMRKFYQYYRNLLEKELFLVQERHYDLIRILKLNKNAEQEFRILKVNPNVGLQALIDRLEGYNSHLYQAENGINGSYYPNAMRSLQGGKSIKLNTEQINLSEEILFDFLTIKAHIFKKWQAFIEFSSQFLVKLTKKYKNDYDALVKQRLSSNVFSHQVISNDWKRSVYEDSGKEHLKQAQVDKKKIQKDQQLWKESFVIENENFFHKDYQNVKIFEEIYDIRNSKTERISLDPDRRVNGIQRTGIRHNSPYLPQPGILNSNKNIPGEKLQENYKLVERKNSLPVNLIPYEEFRQEYEKTLQQERSNEKEDHFIILVHGFQASRQDFVVLKNCLEIRFQCKVFISTINEGRTEDDIQVLGKRFALELQRFLNDSGPTLNYKLSFIGHSMGGIIVRTALCYLQNVDKHLNSYITFSTPHLGYLYEPSTHIQAGLWFLNNWQKTDSIEQICMRDREQHRNCFLYKLSRSKSLNKFKHIALVGSSQDKYVPYQSARVESNQTLIWDKLSPNTGQIISEMIDGLIGNLEGCHQISRMNIIFNIEDKSLDSFIGRTAHVKYLSDRHFIKMFCIVFDRFFK